MLRRKDATHFRGGWFFALGLLAILEVVAIALLKDVPLPELLSDARDRLVHEIQF